MTESKDKKLKNNELFNDIIEYERWNGEVGRFEATVYKEKSKKCEDFRHFWFSIDKTALLNINGKYLCPQHAESWLWFFANLVKVIKGNIKGLIESLKSKIAEYYE
ncbi:hypothetical protein [endosymbiont GvMRE of Glomus versiforme]|uniref:hypothetical protein n=1 Tax=endosymbiont GvMRE of Glomus versiforme TaxID=2039283 RepID=UPI000ECA5D6D|nr:hypothetical protein [endosymbiont GvMRE of Glomus versiforme]RHZ36273.1 hypothetical protein GvMRE_Ic1g19 [endosymbiont GvMRE of Glomus versiforme]